MTFRKPFLISLNHKDVILLIVALFLLTGMVAGHTQTRQPEPLLDQVSAGAMILRGDQGEFAGTGLNTNVRMQIRGMIAEVEVTQSFRNDSPIWVEGIYAFPLPDNAAVNRMQMRIGERLIEGEIQEKQQAQRTYETAKKQGKTASLVSQQRPNMFTSKVANIGPTEVIDVTIGYVQELSYRDGQFSLRFPTTITPRFGGNPGEPLALASLIGMESLAMSTDPTNLPSLELAIELEPGFDLVRLESRYHDIDIAQSTDGYQVTLADGAIRPNRDFELVWEPSLGDTPQSAVLTERFDGEDYALMMVLPPQPKHLQQMPRELILIIDTSGSMHGASLEQAQHSLEMALGTLSPQDRFNLIQFNSTHEILFEQSVAANDAGIGQALDYVQALVADGGTQMHSALEAALSSPAQPGYVRQVVFITDGAISNETALFKLIDDQLGDARLFTVGIGAAPNSYFMRKAAEFGRGSATLIGDITDVAEKMDLLITRLEHPALTDLSANWPGPAETYPSILPDLYLNEPLVVAARLDTLSKSMQLHGHQGGDQWLDQLDVANSREGAGIATLWARRKVESLMDDLAMGAEPDLIRGSVLETALRFALVTRYTSFVAVDKTPVRPTDELLASQRLANAAPRAMNLPQTATVSALHAVFGLLLLMLAVGFSLRLRDDS